MTEPVMERTGPRATFGLRLAAMLIDSAMFFVVGRVLAAVFQSSGSGLGTLAGLAYYIYFEGSASGQTVGKRAMGIRVIDFETGGPIGYGKAAIRYFARILSALPIGLGFFWMLWDKQSQTWHDKLAGSVVVPTSSYPVESWPG